MKKPLSKSSLIPLLVFGVLASSQLAFAESVPEITETEFNKDVQNSQKPFVVDFFASWCPPCRKMGPVLDGLSQSYKDKASFARIDVDKNQPLAQKFQISAIPAVFIFKNGKLVDKSIGLVTAENLGKKIDAAVSAQ
jgi:thioredoxin 1